MKTFALPDLGEGLEEAEIVSWHVAAGDHVVVDQPLLSVETDKAVVEIPSPQSGHIAKLMAEPGQRVHTGDPLVEFEEGAHADTGTVMGDISGVAAPEKAKSTLAAGRAAKPAAPRQPGGEKTKAAPAVRALARQRGVDLAAIAGTGPDGAITRADIDAATRGASAEAPEGYEPLRGVRRSMAENMARAHAQVAATTLTEQVDVGTWPVKTDPTVRLVRAIAGACRAEPSLNAWYDGERQARRLHDRLDLGVAVDTPDGLFVPVIRDAAKLEPDRLRRTVEDLKRQVRDRSIAPADLRGQTFTLSNFGMFGGLHVALMVMPPQVAILGAGRIGPRVVAVGGKPAVRPVLPLSMTFDHRAVTGGEAARFLAAAVADLVRAD